MTEPAERGAAPEREDMLRYIEQMSIELGQMSERIGAGMLVYLLGMVREEAASELAALPPGRPRPRRGRSGQG